MITIILWILGIVLGFCLGKLVCLRKIRKASEKNSELIKGVNPSFEYIGGRIDVLKELLK